MAKRDQPEKPKTKKFGRFEFKSAEPVEVYEGDHIVLDESFVKVLRGQSTYLDPNAAEIVAVVHLDKGQSVREIK